MKRNVIIDCDPGIDDALAIMLALESPELEVAGITIVAGNCPCEMGYQNARKVLHFMDRMDVPVFRGAEKPLRREYVNALDTHGSDGLGESFLPDVKDFSEETETAVEFLARRLSEGDCSVIALGPMTNLAELIRVAPQSFAKAEDIISMGGNFKSHGNCSPVAEYNYWEDPDAARIVFSQMAGLGKTIRMVGLDVTRKIVLTPDLLNYMERLDPKTGDFIRRITKFYFDFHWEWEHIIGCVINDPLAVAIFLQPDMAEGIAAFTDVVTDGIAIGQTVVDEKEFYRKPANAFIYTQVDVPAFWTLFFTRLFHRDAAELPLLKTFTDCCGQ
ncbi:nucleoside hydrolase [[Clostridium] aminophilum]|uniref:Purine nucleosidase n=1 Tax=[Clostridium] aminophilum TaxID=1526 RepID=A0A1I6K9H5_9FIRM|nr:nucleoside hydrolase [[Clostridium] aminophilum]SFR87847.1 purine nucleosidase [[Clostridium] aminophilum]